MRFIGLWLWNTAEYFNIRLGRFAPKVFGWMVGSKGKKTNKTEVKNNENYR